jgi:hypothetical protein
MGEVIMERMKFLFSQFFPVIQQKKVPPNLESTVFLGKIPSGYVGFLDSTASLKLPDVHWTWVVDEEVIEQNVDDLGIFESPRLFAPPYVVKSYIEIRARNDSGHELTLETSVDGCIYGPPMDVIEPVRPIEPLTSILTDIREDMQKKTPLGEVVDELITVTDSVYLLEDKKEGGLNWTSCSITNMGAGNLYFTVNKWKNPEAPIPVGGVQNIDLSARGAIKKIYLKSDVGNTTVASIHALK